MKANSVTLVIPFFQDTPDATTVRTDPELTPSDANVKYFLNEAVCKDGFNTEVRLLMDETALGKFPDPKQNGSPYWRGSIEPKDVNAWFSSYDALLQRYAELAQGSGVDTFSLGSEFTSLEQGHDDNWRQLITDLRKVYHGRITYSVNWDSVGSLQPWMKDLDFLSIDPYFPLNVGPSASEGELETAWKDIIQNRLPAALGGVNLKTVSFAEIGLYPKVGEFNQPWDHGDGLPPTAQGLEMQRRYFQAICNQVVRPQAVAGVYFWQVGLDVPSLSDPGSFDFRGKPAETELDKCFQSN